MKVEGPSKSQKTSKSKGASGAGKTNGTFGAMVTGSAKETVGVGQTQSIAAVDALLSVQSADDPTEGKTRKRMRERGDDLINKLDDIRHGLLTGTMTVGHVLNIADVVASHREKITDPELTGVLDEIDLRAQIEIAKMKKAMETVG